MKDDFTRAVFSVALMNHYAGRETRLDGVVDELAPAYRDASSPLHDAMRATFPHGYDERVFAGTVFRALNELERVGILEALDNDPVNGRYELVTRNV